MMKKIKWVLVLISIFIIVFLLPRAVRAEKVGVFKDILKVDGFALDDQQYYLTQGTTVFIYSKKDLKFIKKFGKAGEGPEEFLRYAYVFPESDHLFINSQGKNSFFTKEGIFIKEQKVPRGMYGGHFFQPMKGGYLGRKMVRENNVDYYAMILCDDKLNEIKEIYRFKSEISRDPEGKINLFKQAPFHRTYQDKLFVSGKPGFQIDVVDADGKLLNTITHKCAPVEFTREDEKTVHEYLKHKYGEEYYINKDRVSLPKYFPELQFFLIRDDKLYVATWKRQDGKVEFLVFDINGKLLKQVFVPCAYLPGLMACPLDIYKGKLYQVIANEDEELELYVSAID
jgi:hypothetical protein